VCPEVLQDLYDLIAANYLTNLGKNISLSTCTHQVDVLLCDLPRLNSVSPFASSSCFSGLLGPQFALYDDGVCVIQPPTWTATLMLHRHTLRLS
jgi:hypothetical protein